MNILVFTVMLAVCSFAASLLGSLTGLGGGVVIVPLLVLVFRTDIHYAIGASLVSVIAPVAKASRLRTIFTWVASRSPSRCFITASQESCDPE
jgi:uncharacterized membrane protein YfcA